VYEIVTIIGKAYLQTATPDKPIHVRGFGVTGIWPYNRTIFKPEDFAAANITEEDMPRTRDQCLQPAALPAQSAASSAPTTSSSLQEATEVKRTFLVHRFKYYAHSTRLNINWINVS